LYTLVLYPSGIKSITLVVTDVVDGGENNTVAAVTVDQMDIACERVVVVVV